MTYTLRDLMRWVLYNGGCCDAGDCDDECAGRCEAVRLEFPESFWTAAELDKLRDDTKEAEHTHECSQCHQVKPCPFSGDCPIERDQKPQCKECVAVLVSKNCLK